METLESAFCVKEKANFANQTGKSRCWNSWLLQIQIVQILFFYIIKSYLGKHVRWMILLTWNNF